MNSIDALKACMTTNCTECPLFDLKIDRCGIRGGDKKVYPNELIRMVIKKYENVRSNDDDRQTV